MAEPTSDHYANDARETAARIRTHARDSMQEARVVAERLESGRPATPADAEELEELQQTLKAHAEQLEALRRGLGEAGLDPGFLDAVQDEVRRAAAAVRETRGTSDRPG